MYDRGSGVLRGLCVCRGKMGGGAGRPVCMTGEDG